MNSTDFLTRLRQAEADTGLHQQQLGITRVYEHPHAATHATGHTSGHLSGEEILVKDLHQVRGEVTTFGSEHQARTAVEDDSATTALLSTGATLVGASSTSEFGVMAYTEPVGQLAPINPVHPGMTPGGSSGGAAVAVSRGLVNIAHATDGGGSIRIPAACCGLPGLKPAHDPTYGGFTSTAHGFLAADLETTARAYDLPISDLAQRTSASPNKNPLRIGYTNTPFHSTSQVDPAIAAATVRGSSPTSPAAAIAASALATLKSPASGTPAARRSPWGVTTVKVDPDDVAAMSTARQAAAAPRTEKVRIGTDAASTSRRP